MQYKTIVLQLLEQRPELHDRLRKSRTMLPTMERCARQLKGRHEAWKEILAQARPGSAASQIASEALELALKELEDRLSRGSPLEENEPLSLDAAMAYLRRTPPA